MSNARTLALPGLVASLFMLVLVPGLWSPAPAAAQIGADAPAGLYGTGLDAGVTVVAWIDGQECGSSTVAANDPQGAWYIPVAPGGCNGGAVSGATITFTVDGVQANETVTWSAGYGPPDAANGISLNVGGGVGSTPDGPVDPDGPPEPPTLSRSQGLAIFSGGTLDDLEHAALALCPDGVFVWANDATGENYLLYVAGAPFPIVNAAFMQAYADGFDGPEPVIVTKCNTTGGS